MGNNTDLIKVPFAKDPVNLGFYDELVAQGKTSFGIMNRVNRYGCEWESLVDNNTDAPAVWDGGDTITPSENWKLNAGNPEAWLMNHDKPAASEQYPFNGMGRIRLQKNLVEVEEGGEIVTKNLLTQAMFEDGDGNPLTNTIYVIQYDFTLGEDITVPANCVLEFDGGSILTSGSNDTITGQNTYINAGLVKIFNTGVTLGGTWKVGYGYPEWFGATGNEITDDTNAFYAALSNFNSIFLSGRYLIDFRDIELENKTIIGKWRTRSGIIQRNSNVPFALVKQYNLLNRFTFFARNNTQITDILHFGYADDTYNSFVYTDITNIVFVCNTDDNYTIPMHFNMQQGGNSDLRIENIRISNCHTGVWFEFHEVEATVWGWLTQCVIKEVTIYNPKVYGFRWDALSMLSTDTQTDIVSPKTMWCYDNYFENISVDLVRGNSIGFYVGQGIGTLVNPQVFNDIKANEHGNTSSPVGYCCEFAPILPPLRPKMVTRIVGGTFEGQVKNMDYAYQNDIQNLKVTLRDKFYPDQGYITLDSRNVVNVLPRMGIFNKNSFNVWSIYNLSLSTGIDDNGFYLKLTRIDMNTNFYFWASLSKSALEAAGLGEGLYTIMALAQSNLGSYSSGFLFPSDSYPYLYEVDGKASSARTAAVRKASIANAAYIKTDQEGATGNLAFAYSGASNSQIEWIKLYNVKIVKGIVGVYTLDAIQEPIKEPIYHWRNYNPTGTDLKVLSFFVNIDSFVSDDLPTGITISGSIPANASGTELTIGTPSYYNLSRKIYFNCYNEDDGSLVGIFSIDTNGTVKLKYTSTVAATTNVFGSM